MKRFPALAAALLMLANGAAAGGVTVVTNLAYRGAGEPDAYARERCVLDLYLPEGRGFASLLWLHGGGLTMGDKTLRETPVIARALAEEGVAVAAANYRLMPKAKFPACVEDAAAAMAWLRTNIGGRGGDTNRVFAGGHSAGAYLASIVAMDRAWLKPHGFDPGDFAGFIPVSGQMMTHFTVRGAMGLGTNCIVADATAPIYHTRPDAPPMLIVMGDRDWPARLEENQYFVAAQKVAGRSNTTLVVVSGRNHGTIASRIGEPGDPARTAILDFIRTTVRKDVAR